MTFEERMDALTARHEALAMNMELIGHDVERLREHAESTNRSIDKLLETARQDGENIRALARIADMHDRRLSNLEGGEIRS
jgi:hypothetical protein